MLEYLRSVRNTMEDSRPKQEQIIARTALSTKLLPGNAWPFAVLGEFGASIREVLDLRLAKQAELGFEAAGRPRDGTAEAAGQAGAGRWSSLGQRSGPAQAAAA